MSFLVRTCGMASGLMRRGLVGGQTMVQRTLANASIIKLNELSPNPGAKKEVSGLVASRYMRISHFRRPAA